VDSDTEVADVVPVVDVEVNANVVREVRGIMVRGIVTPVVDTVRGGRLVVTEGGVFVPAGSVDFPTGVVSLTIAVV
jgi:hypothetical protein